MESGACRNCGAAVASRFCPECGQSTEISVPTLAGLFHEVFSAAWSLDSRLSRTIRVLVSQPGGLTVAYLEGRRAQFLSPFQLFVWLEALTFLVNRWTFDTSTAVSDAKSRDLLIIGGAVAVMLSLLHAPKRRKVIESVVCATHLWSFLMLVLLVEYAVLPLVGWLIGHVWPHSGFRIGITATLIAVLVMVVYTPPALVRVYRQRWWSAALTTLLMVFVYYEVQVLLDRYLHPTIRV